MITGMLWLDANKNRTLEEKVRRAIHYFEDKYGTLPGSCFVPEKTLANEINVANVPVVPAPNITPHHFVLSRLTENDLLAS